MLTWQVLSDMRGHLVPAGQPLIRHAALHCSVTMPLRALGRMLRCLRRGTDDQSLIVGGVAPRSAELRAAAKSALIVCPIWFAANATYNLSVGMTSLTASTVISASSAARV